MTTENNKIIAEFLHGKNAVHPNQYHENWNELMEVVEKIKKVSNEDDFLESLSTHNSRLNIELENQLESCFRKSYLSIEAVYNACVEFIKWYNEQKKE